MLLTSIMVGFLWYQVIAHVGISAGLHRYWAHKSFSGNKAFEIISLYLGILAGSRSPIGWISAHRMHHHHSDTELDPHSPKYKGFWTVFFSQWNIKTIQPKYSKDLYANPRMSFFHKHWGKVWLGSAVVALLISPYVFLSFIVMPAFLALIGFGCVNALCHRYGESRNFPVVNILTAGEGYHLEHHNGKNLRYHKWDLTGFILETLTNMGAVRRLKD